MRRHDNIAALLVELDHRDFDRLALHAVKVAHRPQIHLGAGEKGACAVDIDREATLDAVDDDGLDRLLLVVSFLDLFPCVDALRLLVREVDVALFDLPLVAHDVDLIAGLELGLALVIEHF